MLRDKLKFSLSLSLSCFKSHPRVSRRLASVEIEQTTDSSTAFTSVFRIEIATHRPYRPYQLVVQPLLLPFLIVVTHVCSNCPPQVVFTEWNHFAQTFAFVERTNLSANAFKLGLLFGNLIIFTLLLDGMSFIRKGLYEVIKPPGMGIKLMVPEIGCNLLL